MSEGLNAAATKVVMDFPKSARGSRGQKIDPAVAAAFAQAQATQALAASNDRMATAVVGLTVAVQPAVDAIHALSMAQRALCAILVKHRMKIGASIPIVLTAIMAVSPNLSKMLGDLLKLYGLAN